MEEVKVIFYAWDFSKKDKILMENLALVLSEKCNKPVSWQSTEIASYGEVLHEAPAWGIAFGSMRGISDPDGMVTEIPYAHCLSPSKENRKYRQGTMESLALLAQAITKNPQKPESEMKVYVETKEGHTIGEKDADFTIDEPTAKYLKRIKDLVGGHAYIEKDGMKVEIK